MRERLQRIRLIARQRGIPFARARRLHDVAALLGAAMRRAGLALSARVEPATAREWRASLDAARKVGVLAAVLPDVSPRAAVLAGMVAAMRRRAHRDEMKLWTRAALDLRLLEETSSGHAIGRVPADAYAAAAVEPAELCSLLAGSSYETYLRGMYLAVERAEWRRLKERFPLVFRALGVRRRRAIEGLLGRAVVVPPIAYGFEIGAGWSALVERLARTLEAQISRLPKRQQRQTYAVQVKEKFGHLRFYMTSSTPAMDAAIKRARERSLRTCEDCGKPGRLRHRKWLVTLCDQHARRRDTVASRS